MDGGWRYNGAAKGWTLVSSCQAEKNEKQTFHQTINRGGANHRCSNLELNGFFYSRLYANEPRHVLGSRETRPWLLVVSSDCALVVSCCFLLMKFDWRGVASPNKMHETRYVRFQFYCVGICLSSWGFGDRALKISLKAFQVLEAACRWECFLIFPCGCLTISGL